MKTLYQKLSKENKSKISLPNTKKVLQTIDNEITLDLYTCLQTFWDVYPTKIFNLTLFFDLFK